MNIIWNLEEDSPYYYCNNFGAANLRKEIKVLLVKDGYDIEHIKENYWSLVQKAVKKMLQEMYNYYSVNPKDMKIKEKELINYLKTLYTLTNDGTMFEIKYQTVYPDKLVSLDTLPNFLYRLYEYTHLDDVNSRSENFISVEDYFGPFIYGALLSESCNPDSGTKIRQILGAMKTFKSKTLIFGRIIQSYFKKYKSYYGEILNGKPVLEGMGKYELYDKIFKGSIDMYITINNTELCIILNFLVKNELIISDLLPEYSPPPLKTIKSDSSLPIPSSLYSGSGSSPFSASWHSETDLQSMFSDVEKFTPWKITKQKLIEYFIYLCNKYLSVKLVYGKLKQDIDPQDIDPQDIDQNNNNNISKEFMDYYIDHLNKNKIGIEQYVTAFINKLNKLIPKDKEKVILATAAFQYKIYLIYKKSYPNDNIEDDSFSNIYNKSVENFLASVSENKRTIDILILFLLKYTKEWFKSNVDLLVDRVQNLEGEIFHIIIKHIIQQEILDKTFNIYAVCNFIHEKVGIVDCGNGSSSSSADGERAAEESPANGAGAAEESSLAADGGYEGGVNYDAIAKEKAVCSILMGVMQGNILVMTNEEEVMMGAAEDAPAVR